MSYNVRKKLWKKQLLRFLNVLNSKLLSDLHFYINLVHTHAAKYCTTDNSNFIDSIRIHENLHKFFTTETYASELTEQYFK